MTFRVTVIGNGWSPIQQGGLNRYVTSLSYAIKSRGRLKQTILILGPTGEEYNEQVATVVSNRGDDIITRLRNFRRAQKKACSTSDLIVAHFALNCLPLLTIRRRPPLVFHFHGPWWSESKAMGESRLSSSFKRLVEATVYRKASHFVTLSESFKNVLVTDFGVSQDKISVVEPGVDLEKFGNPNALESFGDKRMRVICVRRLVPRMGIDILLRAWAQVERRGTQLTIVGQGVEAQRLKNLTASLGIDASVNFEGHVSDDRLRKLYHDSFISVVPTTQLEGFGLITLESLSAGVPVIASNIGGLGEFLLSVSPELLVPPGEPDSLAATIQRAIDNPELLPSPEDCRRVAEARSWTRTAKELEELYEEIAMRQSDRAYERS